MRISVVSAAAVFAGLCFANPPISTTSSVTFSQNPVQQGSPVTVSASVSPTVTDTGDLRLEQYFVAGLPASCATPGGSYSQVASTSVVPISTVGISGDTSAVGSFGFRTHFVPAGGSAFHESKSPCTDLVVLPSVGCTGFLIAATQSAGTNLPVAGQKWTGAFTITVSNCTELVVPTVTAQGGTSAWTAMDSYWSDEGSAGIRKSTGGGNKVLLWTIGDMAAQEVGNLIVNLEGQIKAGTASGTVLNINGGWSASSHGGFAAGYTNPLLITVQ